MLYNAGPWAARWYGLFVQYRPRGLDNIFHGGTWFECLTIFGLPQSDIKLKVAGCGIVVQYLEYQTG